MVYSYGAVQGTGSVSHGLGQGLGQGLCKGMQGTRIGVGLAVTVVVLFLGSVLLGSMDTSNTENEQKTLIKIHWNLDTSKLIGSETERIYFELLQFELKRVSCI